LGDNLALVADSLLDAWRPGADLPREGGVAAALARGLLGQLGPPRNRLPATLRLVELVRALNGAHYQAHWEAGAEGPRILFGHCPYAAIIARHPELCEMDRLALGEHMHADAAQLAKINPTALGASQCVFVLRPRRAIQLGPGADADKR
jgi:predicted ArsR family transcriptional regulator